MRVIFKKRTPDKVEFGIIYGGIALLALAAAWVPQVAAYAPDCAFKGVTGVPCPTCGTTRSLIQLSHGNILSALFMNPLAALCMIAAVLYFIYSLATLVSGLPRIVLTLSDKEKNILRTGAAMLLLAQWCYLIATA
jgi:hypothetical protein